MAIIVKKFGGTSLGSGERMLNVARIVENTRLQHQVICVVSAMSGSVKEQGTTSQLLLAADLASKHQSVAAPLKVIAGLHHQAILEAQLPEEVQQDVTAAIGDEIKRLRSFLRAITVIRELSPRSTDALMAVGERLSARLLTAVLQGRGIPARFVDLSGVVPDEETTANSGFFTRLQQRLGALCDPSDGTVPVVTGFFGMVPGGLLKAVGRGYTDFTAALISAGLGKDRVKEMQVWKEVDGILTADPRRVPNARLLPHITPTEAAELTYFGSEVLHPFTMERVVGAEVPIRIKNTFKPEGPGTEIRPNAGKDEWTVTAVTAKRGIVMATVHSNRMYDAHGFLARVFHVLENHQVVVDLVSTSEVSISFTVNKVEEIERSLNDLKALGTVEFRPKRAILACVGEGMKDTPGMAGRMFSTLGTEKINIEMISQGASEINISCVIKEDDVERALQSVHKGFWNCRERGAPHMTRDKARRLFDRLALAIPQPETALTFASDFELLVAVILSAQATDVSVNKVTARLYPVANTPAAILDLGEAGLLGYIRSIGLSPSKAKNIIATCGILLRQHGGQVPRTREELEALPGVGRKTANVVLNVAFGVPTIAVDTHVFRVANRTGLAPGKSVRQVEEGLLAITPRKHLPVAHHYLILHGRHVCKARGPVCGACPVRRQCEWPEKTALGA